MLDHCLEWIASNAPELTPNPASMRTKATGWLYFTSPKGLVCKLEHGRVDVYVGQMGFRGGIEDLSLAIDRDPQTVPAGFLPAVDTKKNPVLRYDLGMPIRPRLGLPVDTSPIDALLRACADVGRWLATGPPLLRTAAIQPERRSALAVAQELAG